jgi:LmbE family N-acetylglucosaminyl deacetylase
MKKEEPGVVLVLAPHTDDGEFGCGGTIARLVEQGARVHYAAFSTCRRSLPAHLDPDTLARECRAAVRKLGAEEPILFDYDVRYFPTHRQPILEDLVKLQSRLKPDLIFIPASTDLHQDHQTIHNEAKRAFKYTRTLGFEQPWNNITMTTNLFSRLEERHVARKVEALLEYRSQLHRHYHNEEFVRSLALTRGTQTGERYAEAFEVIRWKL